MSVFEAGASTRSRRILVPSSGPASWQAFLAKPETQWRTGYSAKTLAHCWEAAVGLPPEIAAMFEGTTELLLAIPEHKVPLPGGSRDSQNDVFALLNTAGRTCAAMIEGKVAEPFGPTVGEWYDAPSEGKQIRMRALCELLGLDGVPPAPVRYQLMHRTASALIEARRFKTDEAAMIVHSFSPQALWFDDFAQFARLLGIPAEHDRPGTTTLKTGQRIRLGWATGNPQFIAA